MTGYIIDRSSNIHVDCGTVEARNCLMKAGKKGRLMKAGKMICVDGRTFQIAAVTKEFPNFQNSGSAKIV